MRRDLALKYSVAIAKDAKLAEDGANIMIANGWFGEPPIQLIVEIYQSDNYRNCNYERRFSNIW
jgi:hypothetical protein